MAWRNYTRRKNCSAQVDRGAFYVDKKRKYEIIQIALE